VPSAVRGVRELARVRHDGARRREHEDVRGEERQAHERHGDDSRAPPLMAPGDHTRLQAAERGEERFAPSRATRRDPAQRLEQDNHCV
jgi:hypothetical protein